MIPVLLASTLLSLAPPPSDLYDEPLALDIGQPPPCIDDSTCFLDTPVCNVETGECVQCLGDEHCPEGWACGPTNSCRDACETETDCEGTSGEILCHPETGLCVQCVDATNCAAEEFCDMQTGFCRFDVCERGQTTGCSNGMVVQCTEDGGPGEAVDICPEGCEVVDGMAQCVTTSGSTGGAAGTSDEAGGSESADGSAGATEGSTMGSPGGTNAPGGSGGAPTTDAGCTCRTGGSSTAWAWAWSLVLGLGLARRRRR